MDSRDTETAELRVALETAGLTQYEAEAYTTIIDLGSASAVEIADACSVPQARIYDVLRELEAKDYIETYKQGSLHAQARNPQAVMEQLDSQAQTLVDAKDELERRWERPTLENHTVSIVKRGKTVMEKASERISEATNEIHLALTGEQFWALKDELQVAYENGVMVKVSLHPKSYHESLPLAEFEDAFEQTVSQVHYRRLPTPFLVIIDRNRLFFTPENYQHPSHEYGMLVNDYSLSHVFHWFFQTALWEPWERVYDDRTDDPPIEYTSMRECIAAIKRLFDESEEYRIVATVYGFDRLDRTDRTITGEVTDITYSGTPTSDGQWPELITYTERATITIETDEDTYSVGGHGTMLEDIEARRITIDSIE
ncbi:TrmB family transcriptional regulator [Haladaptatus sp. NG-SE-30]